MICILLAVLGHALAFNYDLDGASIFHNDNGYFGYSVFLHTTDSEKLILVGSPDTQTDEYYVKNGGTVFKCPIPDKTTVQTGVISCESAVDAIETFGNIYQIRKKDEIIKIYGPENVEGYWRRMAKQGITCNADIEDERCIPTIYGNRTNAFMGVSIAGDGENVVVCGHRFVKVDEQKNNQFIGQCVQMDSNLNLMDDERDTASLRPCDGSTHGTSQNCQVGTSLSYRDGLLVMGAPGKANYIGGAYMAQDYSIMNRNFNPNIELGKDNDQGDGRYLGYSSAICALSGRDKDDGYLEIVLGGPRAKMYRGEVKIFSAESTIAGEFISFDSKDDRVKYEASGEQIGSYFGHSLACTDLNGDGYEDIIIGAPWYTDMEDPSIPADTGRVYVIYGSRNLENKAALSNPTKITGTEPNAAFGFSVAPAGDTNGDNFKDVFVGAPYSNDNSGAVYLFLGTADGISTTPSQTITPLDFKFQPGMKTFGWSISGDKDIDGNGYPDVAIGAYSSNHVTYIWSKSIVDIVTNINFDYDSFNRTAERKSNNLTVCMRYKTRDTQEQMPNKIPVSFSITLDAELAVHSRLSFLNGAKQKVYNGTLDVKPASNSILCTSGIGFWFDQQTKNVQPMKVAITADIDREKGPGLTSFVLNQEMIKAAAKDIKITSWCNPDTYICRVDMEIEGGSATPFIQENESDKFGELVYGYHKRFKMEFTVRNLATGLYTYAYNVTVTLTLPEGITYFGTASGNDVNCIPLSADKVFCILPQEGPINQPKKKEDKFVVIFEVDENVIDSVVTVPIKAEVKTGLESEDTDTGNNAVTVGVLIKQPIDVQIDGGETRRVVEFNNQYTVVNEVVGTKNATLRHEYKVTMSENALEARVTNITLSVWWPNSVPQHPNLFLVPLVNITAKSDDFAGVYCTPTLPEMYKSISAENSYKMTDEVTLPVISDTKPLVPDIMDCANSDQRKFCTRITCNIEWIERGAVYSNGFKLTLTGRVFEANLYGSEGLNVTSYAQIERDVDDSVLPKSTTATATTVLKPSVRDSRDYKWYIIIAIILGLLLLLLLILCLWRCGFFKRKQPPGIKADRVEEDNWQTYEQSNI